MDYHTVDGEELLVYPRYVRHLPNPNVDKEDHLDNINKLKKAH